MTDFKKDSVIINRKSNATFVKPSEKDVDEAIQALAQDDYQQVTRVEGTILPMFLFFFNFILPFSGCAFFCFTLYEHKAEQREKWTLRALYLSCALCALYAYASASLVRAYTDF